MNQREFNDLYSKRLYEITADSTLGKEEFLNVVKNDEELKSLVRQRKISIEKQTPILLSTSFSIYHPL